MNDNGIAPNVFRGCLEPTKVLHYLYFPTKEAAREVSAKLRDQGFSIEQRLGADGENWLLLARQDMVPSEEKIAAIRKMMEDLSESFGGEYDGWEAELRPQ